MDSEIKKELIVRRYSKALIEKCEEIDKKIEHQVNVRADIVDYDYGGGSITFEYDKQNSGCFRFEVFESQYQYTIQYIFCYSVDSKYHGMFVTGQCSENRIIEIVKKLYKLNEEKFGRYLEKGGKKYERELKRNVLF